MSELVSAPTEAPRRRGRDATRETWIDRLARFSASGLSPAQFCATEGVSLPSFYAWKRRLAADALRPAAPRPAADPGPRLLPVRLPAAGAAVELLLPGGAVLRIPPGSDPAFVRALARALGDEPC
jgi:transposase